VDPQPPGTQLGHDHQCQPGRKPEEANKKQVVFLVVVGDCGFFVIVATAAAVQQSSRTTGFTSTISA
jgi:hypothetical protein